MFYLFASILQLGQHLGQQKKNFLHLPCEKEQNMATIYVGTGNVDAAERKARKGNSAVSVLDVVGFLKECG